MQQEISYNRMNKHKVGEARKQPSKKSVETEVKKRKEKDKTVLDNHKGTQEKDIRGVEYKRKAQKIQATSSISPTITL